MQAGEVTLPNSIVTLFEGTDPGEHVGFAVQLITTDLDGWPRVALLSAGEVIAPDAGRLRIALWPGSNTTANLTRTGRAVLMCVLDQAAHSIRLVTCRGEDLAGSTRLAVFDGRVTEVRRDAASYALLDTGITFRLVDETSVVERWRETVAALGRHPGCEPSSVS